MRQITLPESKKNDVHIQYDIPDSLIILGANGSGKSRLGSWIENHHLNVKRISAQRLLTMPNYAAIKSLEQSLQELTNDWRGRSVIDYLNDYEIVLSSVFASTSKRDSDYVKLCRDAGSGQTPEIPDSAIDKLIKIWNSILPHRTIQLDDSKVTVKAPNGAEYHGSGMSDGERVALYLICQSLVVPQNTIVIIDEPELHMHKSLMSRLWNKIEEEREDCIFIYITHDLDFAASRVKAQKIWVKAFQDACWEWESIPDLDDIPENLFLEIIGSRKPVLFVEGEKGSYDHAIYQAFYPDFTIIPRGSCSKVIESTKALNENPIINNTIKGYGIIDRDYRVKDEIDFLISKGINIIDVAEVENILLTPEIVEIVANHLVLDPKDCINKVSELLINSLSNSLNKEISFRTSMEVNYKLNCFDQKQEGIQNIKDSISKTVTNIDVDKIFQSNETLLNNIISNKDLKSALRYHTNKGLLPNASKFFGLHGHEYAKLILRLLKSDKKLEILKALEQYLPTISHV